MHSELNDFLRDPLGKRNIHKKEQGITMIIDKGLGNHSFLDLVETAGNYIDFIKLGFGTTALYPEHILENKIGLAKKFGIDIYPGGTFFEVAFHQGKRELYFETLKQMGFNKIEISDGTIELTNRDRQRSIQQAKSLGFTVITEYGKKAEGSVTDSEQLLYTINADLEAGASFVIVEGRESGENVGIYDSEGKIQDHFPMIARSIQPYINQVIWEAPKKSQQVELMNWFGPNVHLGNIAPDEIYSVESLRRGLRSDTFFMNKKEEANA
ncbi:MAG TPA: phosphosulfolactate synthase [Bacillota bacterium]|nr:phosphosulfolactate synthase [Bacillota bacterium]